jgi:hypothetical protein
MTQQSMARIFDGFWLPKQIRQQVITPDTPWEIQRHRNGMPVDGDSPDVVAARWPRLSHAQFGQLLKALADNRSPVGSDFLVRLDQAITNFSRQFADLSGGFAQSILYMLSDYTGYSSEMIGFAIGMQELTPLDSLQQVAHMRLPDTVRSGYVPMSNNCILDGRIRLFETGMKSQIERTIFRCRASSSRPLPMGAAHPDTVLGYAAGNVIGASHLITLLAQTSALITADAESSHKVRMPVILVKNSRHEPMFTPMVFSALEAIDPALVSTVAVLIWDYENMPLQEYLISQANLVIAAAADSTIADIDRLIHKVRKSQHEILFHKHGHKVSFSTIALPYLKKGAAIPGRPQQELIDAIGLLSAVDSMFWNQNGCVSSRIHFVEHGDESHYSPVAYGNRLAAGGRLISTKLSRGNLTLQSVHNRFEKYSALTSTGKVHLCSTYQDDFLVVVDERPWSPQMLQATVNDCIERTIIIRPVESIMDVPDLYLCYIPSANLQSMMVAIDGVDHSIWSERFSNFADAIGKQGVTAVRTVGRGPFPQLAYSWDGYLPLDLSVKRPPGYFTTVEFENTYAQIVETYAVIDRLLRV